MSLRGVIRGCTIELEQELPLPDGTQVESGGTPLPD
jgi:Fe2+ transport system protein FeoA